MSNDIDETSKEVEELKAESVKKRKNPAYGRQSISRPMRIVAPIPKTSQDCEKLP